MIWVNARDGDGVRCDDRRGRIGRDVSKSGQVMKGRMVIDVFLLTLFCLIDEVRNTM